MPHTLTYFNIRGRGEPIRLLMEDAGVAYNDDNDVKAFVETKTNLDLFPYQQLPVLQLEDGTRLVQQDAILRYLCAEHGYTSGANAKEQYAIDSLACAIDDFNNYYVDSVYSKKEPIGCELLPFVQGQCQKSLKSFEHLLSKSTSEYWFGAKPAFPEFTLLHLLLAVQVLSPALLEPYPRLAAWQHKMLARAGIKAYLESGRQRKQINGTTNGLEAVCA